MNSKSPIMIFFVLLVCGAGYFLTKSEKVPVSNQIEIVGPQNNASSSVQGDDDSESEQLVTLVTLMKGQVEMSNIQKERLEELERKINIEKTKANSNNIDQSSLIDLIMKKLKSSKGSIYSQLEKELLKVKNDMLILKNRKTDQDGSVDLSDYGIGDKFPDNIILGGGGVATKPNVVVDDYPQKYTTVNPKMVNGWYVGEDTIIDVKTGKVTGAINQSDILRRNFGIVNIKEEENNVVNNIKDKGKDPYIPFATINQEATLIGATTMTALLGRIPVGGTLVDPYEFKVLIGKENLAASGLYLDNISRIVMRGVAKGDYTGQCTSGDIIAATFIFNDGRIQTINASDLGGENNDYESAGTVTKQRLGWISTSGGVPCIGGEYISDAPSFIALQGGLSALGALAEGYSSASQENMGIGDNRQSVITNAGQYAAGQAGAAATQTATDWLNEIKESAFGLVYIPTAQKVDIHITQELRIDYHLNGRKIMYENFNNGGGNDENFYLD